MTNTVKIKELNIEGTDYFYSDIIPNEDGTHKIVGLVPKQDSFICAESIPMMSYCVLRDNQVFIAVGGRPHFMNTNALRQGDIYHITNERIEGTD